MAQGEKRLEEMRRNPANDWQISDVQVVCNAYGITLLRPSGSSHYKVAHASQREILTVVANRPIKAVYMKRFVKFADAVTGVDR
jgi:intracellular sulfur oxidation DsrE/DsrF family protein